MNNRTTTHVVSINSSSRNQTSYPSAAEYQVDLPQRYRNIWSAQLLNMVIPEMSPRQRVICLRIDKLNSIDSTVSTGGVNFCFAKIPLLDAIANVYYADAMTLFFPTIPLQNPIATMDRLSISLTDLNGNVLTTSIGNANNHTMTVQFNCGDYISNGGGSTITQNGRVLGGSR